MKRLMWIVCLAIIAGPESRVNAQEPAKPQSDGVEIVSAVYGSGDRFADVTERTKVLFSRGEPFYASPQWLREDPTPGWNKAFVIVYTYKGERRIFTVGEDGEVTSEKLTKWKPW